MSCLCLLSGKTGLLTHRICAHACSFDEPVKGCDYVIHTASPYIINVAPSEVRSKLLEPAVKGTEHVLSE